MGNVTAGLGAFPGFDVRPKATANFSMVACMDNSADENRDVEESANTLIELIWVLL